MFCDVRDCIVCYVLGMREHESWGETVLALAVSLVEENKKKRGV